MYDVQIQLRPISYQKQSYCPLCTRTEKDAQNLQLD